MCILNIYFSVFIDLYLNWDVLKSNNYLSAFCKYETEEIRLLSVTCLLASHKTLFLQGPLSFTPIKFFGPAFISPKDFMLVPFLPFCQCRLYLYKPWFYQDFFDCKIILCCEEVDIAGFSVITFIEFIAIDLQMKSHVMIQCVL